MTVLVCADAVTVWVFVSVVVSTGALVVFEAETIDASLEVVEVVLGDSSERVVVGAVVARVLVVVGVVATLAVSSAVVVPD